MFLTEIIVFLYDFFWKKQKVSEGLRRLFYQKISEHLSRGEIALKLAIFRIFVKKLNCSYLLIKSSKKHFESIFELIDFFCVWAWNHWFLSIFLRKIYMFLRGREAFPVINFSSIFPRRIPLLKFRISDFWEKLNCS